MTMHKKVKSKAKGGSGKAGKGIEKAAMAKAGGKTKGPLIAKPGAKYDMKRNAAMGGKTPPGAQSGKPKKTHTIKKATK